MALATEKLYYRRSGITYSINLYTSITDVGSEYTVLKHANGLRYAKIGLTSDTNASHLRVQKGGSTKAILTVANSYVEVGVWSILGSLSQPSTYSTISQEFTRNFDYDRVFSSSSPYNLRIQYSGGGAQGTNVSVTYLIDGESFVKKANSAYSYHRLPTGSHTITLYAKLWDDPFSTKDNYYKSNAYTVI
jgi:hypothetical protein